MGLSCVFGHKWNACTCERCGKINDKLHKWNHCTCEVCGKNRGTNHKYVSVLDTYEKEDRHEHKCLVCGQIAWDGADWDDSPVWEQGEVE